ncbi:hypothetical protein [Micromonospora chersina]|uniref:Uncharacterized protein n=1 Tax=Micromonospora chersina TaxID=47854 RepID=A0A1C6VQL4_9ACTN|nr:hypothetical protein [Micromonospora chersina]SCL68477.1 hypothetical protein GA0070603_4766 [Micromonospora chersina]
MAFRTWGRLLLTALGVSVLAGAGQLGIAYGFGVVRLDGAFVDGSVNRWPAQLAWVGWFAAVATIAGAVLTERLARRDASPAGTAELLSIAGVSAVGATVVAPLCMQPARAAELGGTVDPVWAVGICAILGAVVGAGAAIAVLLKPPFGWSVALTAAAVWLLALISVAPSVASTGTLPTVRLGVLEPSWLDPAAAQRLAMLVLPTLALLAGAAVGVLARRAGHLPLVGGAAGAAGPVLLAFAYLTAGPGTAADRYQLAPYYGALIAVAAGALGSTATTVLPRPATTAAGPDAIEPTDILQPLPAAPATSDPAPTAPVTVRAPGAPSPAHWDWPEAGGLTPAGLSRRPFDRPAAELPADRAEPTPVPEPAPVHGPTPAHEPAPGTVDEAAVTGRDSATAPAVAGEAASDHHWFGAPTPSGLPSEQRPDVAPAHHTAAPQPHPDPTRPAREADDSGADRPDTQPAREADDSGAGRPDTRPARALGDTVPEEPAAGRDDADLVRNLQMPGSPPPGRRTSAIDVLAAGRPTPPADPAPVTPPAPPVGITPPVESARPAAGTARAVDRTGAAPVERDRTDVPDPAAAHEVPGAVPAEPATEVAPARATRPRRNRAGSPTPTPPPADQPLSTARSADDASPTVRALDDAPSAGRRADRATPAGTPSASKDAPPAARPAGGATAAEAPAAEAAVEPDVSAPAAPAPVGRAKRTRKPRTTRAATDQVPAEPSITTPASTTGPTPTTTPGSTTVPAITTPSGTAEPSTTPASVFEPTGSIPAAAANTPTTGGEAKADVPATHRPEAPDQAPVAGTTGGSTPTAGERRNFFFAPEPPPADLPEPPASPRPRVPIFEDVTPGDVRPAWPIAPATNWPVAPRGGAGSTESGAPTAGRAGDPDGTGTPDGTGPAHVTRPEPAPRPRHRALPDLGRSTGWDALANARPAGPATPPPTDRAPETTAPETSGPETAGPEATGHSGPAPESTGRVLPAWDGQAAQTTSGGRHADVSGADAAPEAAGGKSKARRGLFRRNRGKGGEPGEVDRESEPLPRQDEEYVDWVAGLASDDDADDTRSLRTGRHHRD